MFTLVVGGSASGKSEYAEQHMLSLPGDRVYIATMDAWDEESRKRVEKHRKMRAGRGFFTIECPTDLASAPIPKGSNCLLEDLDNLVANETFSEAGKGPDAVLKGIGHVLEYCEDLTVVAGELFSGGSAYLDDTVPYLKTLARINRELAARADHVVEVVCGLPNPIK